MEAPKFLELKAREEVLEVVHGTLTPRLPKFFLCVVWLVLPFFLLFPLWKQGTIGIVIFFLWIASGIILLFRQYLKWSRTLFVITDQRVVDQEQKGFFNRVVTQTRYDQIDEVSYQVKGIVPTLLRYGTVRLELHGASADIVVPHVLRPAYITDLLNDLRTAQKPAELAKQHDVQ
ncbi:PH domain-containing protein [Candidatus Uhrbacteria bacterium]|nr:PH domain-containing protein [Candidatus Uhrbacteria bacterium]